MERYNQPVPEYENLFDDYVERPFDPTESESEIDRYKKLTLSLVDIEIDPLEFWSINRNNFPRLSMIASWILSASATNISSERSFSAVGNVITPHQNSLSPDTVDRLIFVRSDRDML